MMGKITINNKGYVRVVDSLGSDLSVVNAARVSFAKESEEMSISDEKLLKFLAREGHTSPFRHIAVSFEIYAPLMVARQWWKYVVGSDHTMEAWNESSRRYITEVPEFYEPEFWRAGAENKKQGSAGDLPKKDNDILKAALKSHYKNCLEIYDKALDLGVAVEQARLFLPAYGMLVRWRWTTSGQGLIHFLSQRLADDAQREIQLYALAVKELSIDLFPKTFEAYGLQGKTFPSTDSSS